jgi:hypothetical protein
MKESELEDIDDQINNLKIQKRKKQTEPLSGKKKFNVTANDIDRRKMNKGSNRQIPSKDQHEHNRQRRALKKINKRNNDIRKVEKNDDKKEEKKAEKEASGLFSKVIAEEKKEERKAINIEDSETRSSESQSTSQDRAFLNDTSTRSDYENDEEEFSSDDSYEGESYDTSSEGEDEDARIAKRQKFEEFKFYYEDLDDDDLLSLQQQ